MIINRPRAAARDDTKKTGVERRHFMICLQSGGAIEGKIVELIGEYGALRMEQLQRYFSIEDTQMEKNNTETGEKGQACI